MSEWPDVDTVRPSMAQPTVNLPETDRSNGDNNDRDPDRAGSRGPDDDAGTKRRAPDAAPQVFAFGPRGQCGSAARAARSLPGRSVADRQQAAGLDLGLRAVLFRQPA